MSDLSITPYQCPQPGCVGGWISDGHDGTERCPHCAGSGLTDDPMDGATRAPRPRGVMPAPCGDCAFRPGSPELEENIGLPQDEPFYCHQGMPMSSDGRYQPVATYRGLPLGAMVCAGWWATRTGEAPPDRPYRELPLGEAGVDRLWGITAMANVDRYAARQAWKRERALIEAGRSSADLDQRDALLVPHGYAKIVEAASRYENFLAWARTLGVSPGRADAALTAAFDAGYLDATQAYHQARQLLVAVSAVQEPPATGASPRQRHATATARRRGPAVPVAQLADATTEDAEASHPMSTAWTRWTARRESQ